MYMLSLIYFREINFSEQYWFKREACNPRCDVHLEKKNSNNSMFITGFVMVTSLTSPIKGPIVIYTEINDKFFYRYFVYFPFDV